MCCTEAKVAGWAATAAPFGGGAGSWLFGSLGMGGWLVRSGAGGMEGEVVFVCARAGRLRGLQLFFSAGMSGGGCQYAAGHGTACSWLGGAMPMQRSCPVSEPMLRGPGNATWSGGSSWIRVSSCAAAAAGCSLPRAPGQGRPVLAACGDEKIIDVGATDA